MMSPSRLTIFEGPDGGGKTTAAKAWAERTGALYMHHDASAHKDGAGVALEYVNSMLPALRGTQAIVMDRCWISEPIYGEVYWKRTRLNLEAMKELRTLALNCQRPTLVMCLPKWESVLASFRSEGRQEMLKKEAQLREVFDLYDGVEGLEGFDWVEYAWDEPRLGADWLIRRLG